MSDGLSSKVVRGGSTLVWARVCLNNAEGRGKFVGGGLQKMAHAFILALCTAFCE